MEDQSSIHQRETDFHDEWARSTDIRSISVREAFEAPTAMENRFLLAQMGSLAGKRLLDVGAGLGESSVYFALQGAQVTTTDISPEMVETALKLGQLYGVKLEGAVSIGESLSVPENSYDFVYLANVIHHVHDRTSLFGQAHRALKPGGRFFCLEFSRFQVAVLQPLYDAWSFQALPRLGRCVAKDAESYRYLAESIREFPDQEALAGMLRSAGFSRVAIRNLSGGIAAIHSGWRL